MWGLSQVKALQMVDFGAVRLVAHHQLSPFSASETLIFMLLLHLRVLSFLLLLPLFLFLLLLHGHCSLSLHKKEVLHVVQTMLKRG